MCRPATPCGSASRRDSNNFFWTPVPSRRRGAGGPDRGKTQKSKFAKFKILKLANRKNQNFENFHRNFFHEIDREIVSRKIAFLFSRSAARPSLLRRLPHHSQCARCILNASKQCPYEATTATRLNSHGSEERTQEDTMNPMRRSPSLLVEI